MAFDPPTLPPFQPDWTQFQIWWQSFIDKLKAQEQNQDDLLAAVIAAQDAADTANAAAAAADAAATTANAAAATAQTTADDLTSSTSLQDSWVTGTNIITATDAGTDVTVTIAAHTRHYPQPDGTTVDVSVSGGSITGLPYSTAQNIYYSDPTRAGGAVTYLASTADVAQIGDTHVVGTAPGIAAASPPTYGGFVRGPGQGSIA